MDDKIIRDKILVLEADEESSKLGRACSETKMPKKKDIKLGWNLYNFDGSNRPFPASEKEIKKARKLGNCTAV